MTKERRHRGFILHSLYLIIFLGVVFPVAAGTNTWRFNFNPGKTASGYTQVLPATIYSKDIGYGFLQTNMVRGQPFYFSVDVPEGNYRVTVRLGDARGASTNTIKAEARRLMVENVRTAKGKFKTLTFMVNVRRPELKSGGRVRLKKDELAGHMDWDGQLTLEFNGSHPCVATLQIEKVEKVPVIYIAGDSTVCDQGKEPWAAWGQMLPRFFGPDIVVANNAESGETLKSFQGEKRNEKVFDTLKAGDYLFIQFGHNDQKPGGAHADAFTTYEDLLKQDIAAARARGAIPALVSSVNRRTFDDAGKIQNSLGNYPEAVRQVAKEENVPLIDLNALSKVLFEAIGPEDTKKVFVHFPANTFPGQDKELKDDTHFTAYGAYELARCIVEGIKASMPDLKKHLVRDVMPFNPAKPDSFSSINLPASPYLNNQSTDVSETNVVQAKNDFLNWAMRPPMGWNSWDCFATTVTEAQTKAEADVMADKLKSHGWQYVVVDIQWFEPQASSFNYRKGAALVMDEFGRLWPATNRFPSAMNEVGFKALADYIHGRGLKFGIHLLRGIPRQAVVQNIKILGADAHAADIADTNSICSWNSDMFGVDMGKPGAQEYYDSVFDLIASWDVDFVKVDDLSRPYHTAEIEAIRKAIDRTGRPMVLSLSPGATPLTQAGHVTQHANMWRISDDFWDNWKSLREQFARCRNWSTNSGPGHFADADMLPLGTIDLGRRTTHFTPDEQRTLMTLWCIFRSPLIMGGDLTKLDDATLALLTNDELLAVDQNSSANRELFDHDGLIAWTANVPDTADKYLALFNTGEAAAPVSITLKDLGFAAECHARDLWEHKDLGTFSNEFAPVIPPHGAGLFRISGAVANVQSSDTKN